MVKNVLVVTGSPRKNGNSEMLADAFIKGAKEAGHIVEKFASAFCKIDGCRACDTCWSKGAPCSFADDFNEKFAPLLERAEVLVFSIPLYFYSFPAQVKAAMDKMYAYAVPACQRKLSIRQSAFLICGGDEGEASYGGAVESYRQVAKFCGWEDRGVLVADGVMAKGDIVGTGFLEKAEELGAGI